MKFTVTDATNFLRVLRLPKEFPSDYCFGGGHPATFLLIDWFNAFSPQDFWEENVKEFPDGDAAYATHVEELKTYIKGKRYFDPDHTFLVLTDYGDVFLVNPEKRSYDLQLAMDALKKGWPNHD